MPRPSMHDLAVRKAEASDRERRDGEVAAWAHTEHADTSVYATLYDRPTLLELAGDVSGRRVLDAGCGSGGTAEELLQRGAHVTAFDASAGLVELAPEQGRDAAATAIPDVAPLLMSLPEGGFDVAIMARVLHRLDDPVRALRELHRVLGPAGLLVLSIHHPMLDWLRFGGSYFDVERVEDVWAQGSVAAFWRQPLSDTVDDLAGAGFVIEKLVEPRPSQAVRRCDPVAYANLTQRPAFIAMRLAKRGT